jgi:hypothetical protein
LKLVNRIEDSWAVIVLIIGAKEVPGVFIGVEMSTLGISVVLELDMLFDRS